MMRSLTRLALLLMSLFLAACNTGAAPSSTSVSPITIEKPWARPVMVEATMTDGEGEMTEGEGETAMGMGSNSAAYMQIINTGNEDDRLVSGSVDFATVELHQTSIEDGVAKMQQMTEGVAIAAGETLTLEPGGYHVMLIGVKNSLEVGDEFDLTLVFEKAGTMTVSVDVRQP